MSKYVKNTTTLFAFFVALAANVNAQEHEEPLKAHVHGTSELTVVIEGNKLEINSTTPGMDIVGFEYKASTQKEIASVKKAKSELEQHNKVFSFSGASCQHVATSIDMAGLIEDENHSHDDHDEHKGHDEHEEHHDHDEHEDHDDHKGHKHYADVRANYQYTCDQAASLTSIKIGLFELFPSLQKVNVMWINQNKQGSVTIDMNNPFIKF